MPIHSQDHQTNYKTVDEYGGQRSFISKKESEISDVNFPKLP